MCRFVPSQKNMEDVNLDEANVEALIAEEAKAEKAKRAELSSSVPDDFIG